MFDRFLEDHAVYLQCEDFWKDVGRQILDGLALRDSWTSWLTTHFADGTKFFDGDPMYSQISLDHSRALKVIQVAPFTGDEPTVWFDSFDDRIPVLVIKLSLNPASLQLCKMWLAIWLDLRIPPEEAMGVIRAGAADLVA